MKIAINLKPLNAPWGGGNRFIKSFKNYFANKDHEVVFSLNHRDIDIILIIDPRPSHPQSSFSVYSVLKYINNIKEDTIVVHRINECDERKKTNNINNLLRNANYFSDHTVLVGSWLKNLNILNSNNVSVILNGADEKLFYYKEKKINNNAINLVTHHWSNNWMKGFDIYDYIDKNIVSKNKNNKYNFKFTYIGNIPSNYNFENSIILKPLDGKELVNELHKHNIYITASINEPGGNHQNEGALCGLPMLYRDSGCLPEYCDGFGVKFKFDDFEKNLFRLIENYNHYSSKMTQYPNSASNMNSNYYNLFTKLILNKKTILKKRKFHERSFDNLTKFLKYSLSFI